MALLLAELVYAEVFVFGVLPGGRDPPMKSEWLPLYRTTPGGSLAVDGGTLREEHGGVAPVRD